MKRHPKILNSLFVFLTLTLLSGGFFVFGKDNFSGFSDSSTQQTLKREQSVQMVEARPESYPNILSITPENGASGVIVDIEDPLVVRFDRSVKNFFVDFRFDHNISLTYQNNEEKTAFQLLPKEQLQPQTQYSLSIWVKRRGEGDESYTLLRTSTFTTLASKPESWNKNLELRLEEAKKYTRPKILEGKYIDINLESQVMVLFENGRLADAYIISSGKRGMETPKGEFSIQNKAKRPLSKRYGLFMPNWMALSSDGSFGIHELPEWPGGYKEGAAHLGIPVSHGCVRLGVGAAKRVYEWSDIGTQVSIY